MVTGSSSSSLRRDAEAVLRPDPRRHVERVLGWVFCWPWDLVWMLCVHNPIREITRLVVNEIRSTLDDITRGELQAIEGDFVVDRPVEPVPPTAATVSMKPQATIASPATTAATIAPPQVAIGPLGPLYPDDPWLGSRDLPTDWRMGNDGGSVLQGVLRQVRSKGSDT